MSGYSDIISELSSVIPLNILSSWTSEKVIAGQYSSLSISVASDTDTSVIIQFSNDGVNWDININKNYSPGSSYQNIVILSKWVRIFAQNVGIANQTYLRIYTYGSVSNTSLNAIISKIGNYTPEVAIDNLPLSAFGDLRTVNDKKELQLIFTYGVSGAVRNRSFIFPNDDLKAYSASAGAVASFSNNSIRLTSGISQLDVGAMIYSVPVQYQAGTGVCARFTGRFRQSITRINTWPGYQCQLLGIGNENGTGDIVDGFFWGNVDTVSGILNFGIHHYRNGSLVNTYLQAQWNVDRCDGSGNMPVINFIDAINIFEIKYQYLGAGNIYFYIENPNDGKFTLVHIIKYANANTTTSLSNPALGFMMYARTDSSGRPVSNIDELESCSCSISIEGSICENSEIISVSSGKTGITVPNNILSITNGATFLGKYNRKPIIIDYFSVSCDGTKPTSAGLFKSSIITSPLLSTVNANLTPILYDISGILMTKGQQILQFEMIKTDRIFTNLREYNIYLHPRETLNIICSSQAASEINATIGWHD